MNKKVMDYIINHYPCGSDIAGWHTTKESLVITHNKIWHKDGNRMYNPKTIIPLEKVYKDK